MAIFYDDKKQSWEILITLRTMYRLKELTTGHRDIEGDVIFHEPLDLANLGSNDAFAVLENIYPRTVACYLLCKKQADKRGITEGQFLDLMLSEESLAGMTMALFAAIEESFPNEKVRALARKVREAEATRAKAVTYSIEEFLDNPEIAKDAPSDEEIKSKVKQGIAQAFAKTRGKSSQEESASSGIQVST